MMDRLELFEIFVRVVDCTSFTRAADQLGRPRSSVSTAVRLLETRVGARLLDRTTRRVVPTDEGLALYERCRRVLVEAEEAETLFHENQAGRVRVNVPGRVGRRLVAPALPAFLAAHPGLEIDLGVTDRPVNLVGEGVDCVLRIGPLADSSLVGRWIADVRLINVASPTYLAVHGAPLTPDDLGGHLAVNYASPTNGRIEPWEWVEDGAVRVMPMPGSVSTNDAETAIVCCLTGAGLLQVPAYDVAEHLVRGELVEVMPDNQAEPMPAHLLMPDRRHTPPRVRLFADWLETLFRQAVASGELQAGLASSRLSR